MEEGLIKHIGNIGTFGIFTLLVLFLLFKYGIPAIRKKDEPAPAPDPKPEGSQTGEHSVELLHISHQVKDAVDGIKELKEQSSEIRTEVKKGFEAVDERINGLWSSHRNLREACAATHGRPPGGRPNTGKWSTAKGD